MAKKRKTKKPVAKAGHIPLVKKGLSPYVWAALGAILLLTIAVYYPGLDNEFTNWDDTGYVLNNAFIRSLDLENLGNILTQPVVGNYHPLTVFSLALNYQVSGTEPYSYHVVNLLLHLANTVLVFFLILQLSDRKTLAALFTALFFAIHPMHVESVAWVAERKDVLYTFFFLASLISYTKFIRKKAKRHFWWALGWFILSLASKPAAVILPLVLLLIDYLLERKWEWRLLLEKIPFFAFSLIMGVLTLNAQAHTINIIEEHSLLEKLLFACYSLLAYLGNFFTPFQLSAFHPYPPAGQSFSLPYVASPLILILFAGLSYLFLRKNRPVIFGLSFFAVNLLLVLQVLAVGNAIMAERYTYVPYIGLLFPLGLWAERSLQKANGKWSYPGFAVLALSLLATGFFAYLSRERVEVWQSSETIWRDVIEKHPENVPAAYNNLGLILKDQGKEEEALDCYSKAIEQKPNYHLPMINRGVIFLDQGKYDEALADINRGLEIAPDYEKGLVNRAGVYIKTQQFEKAVQDYDKALQIDPFLIQAYFLRGYAKLSLGRHDEALNDLDKAIGMNDKNGEYYLYRSFIYNAMGNKQRAREDAFQAQQRGANVDQKYLNGLQ